VHILIVDDDDIVLETLQGVLEQAGHEVTAARDGRSALEILRRSPIRLVISDWMMPGLSGVELCRAIRSDDFPAYIYTILLTGRSEKEDVVEGLRAGADDYVGKPFDGTELLMRVEVGRRVLAVESRHVTIFALARLAESRDPETGQHLERMRNYCRALGRRLSQTEEFRDASSGDFIEMLYLTSPLHDIGKVGIPDSILLKPGRLSDREFEIMKGHTTIGADTLESALREHPEADYLRMARDIARTHHEQFDGSGYPNGLEGDQIPLCGAVVSLADVYDALISKRVYKNALSHEVARGIILDKSGTQFDPRIVEAFLDVEDEFVRIQQEFNEDDVPEAAALGA
jgi:putative two-component system response regulator